jgi:hypothetical protein
MNHLETVIECETVAKIKALSLDQVSKLQSIKDKVCSILDTVNSPVYCAKVKNVNTNDLVKQRGS